MKNILQVSIFIFIILIQFSCSKDSSSILPLENQNTDLSGPIDPADADLLSQVLIFPDGVTQNSGSAPSPTNTSDSPIISTSLTEAISSNGSTVLINFGYGNVGSNIGGCYVQVDGAGNYYTLPYDNNSGVSGTLQLPIGIPTNVIGGVFCVNYCIYDTNGNISNILNVCVNVLELGSGNLQVSLSWDTATDQDLHVVDPSGTTIYFANKFSNTGGQLDRDDLDGFGPENIFWSDVAPNGEYEVLVHDYEGTSTPNNFSITISTPDTRREFTGATINGDKVSVCTFTKSGDALFF